MTPSGVGLFGSNIEEMRIHKEGIKTVLWILLFAVALMVVIWRLGNLVTLWVVGVLLAAFLLFVLNFFRSPRRVCVRNDELIYSPCDGRVVAVEQVEEDEVLGDKRWQVSIFMSVWNVHINWFPCSGKVSYSTHHPGKFLVAWHPKSSTENERSTVVVDRPDGPRILFRQIAGAVARRIVTNAKAGDEAVQGAEMGFIKFGSRVDIFLPLDAEILVKVGDKTTGMQTPVGKVAKQPR